MAKKTTSPDDLLSSREAGLELGITSARVLVLIGEGRLPATRIDRFWVIRRGDLDLVRDRPPGRPRTKTKEEPKGPDAKQKRKPKRGGG